MYSRNFGETADTSYQSPTIRSEGQLYNLQNELRNGNGSTESVDIREEVRNEPTAEVAVFGKLKKMLGGIEADDLILLAIGVLILLDGDSGNDMLIVFILALLFL